VADYYLVELANGPEYDTSRDRRDQDGWDEHASFIDGLADEGFIHMAGPIGDGNVLQVVKAASPDEIVARLSEDPWFETVLTIVGIRPWEVWVRGRS
jgi:uncharacterized protein YciI